MRRRTPKDRYQFLVRKQQKLLEEFAEHEMEWAEHLFTMYRLKKIDMPDDEYRGCSYFLNKEFQKKTGTLTLLYEMCNRCYRELPEVNKENAFDILRFRFRMYAQALGKWEEINPRRS